MKNIVLSLVFCICLLRSVLASGNLTTTTKIPPSSTSLKSSSPTTTAAPFTTKSNGTWTTVAPTTTPALTCPQRNSSCGDCVEDLKCFWCGADDTCRKYPSSKIIPRDCKDNKWYWKQCVAAGNLSLLELYIYISLGPWCMQEKQQSESASLLSYDTPWWHVSLRIIAVILRIQITSQSKGWDNHDGMFEKCLFTQIINVHLFRGWYTPCIIIIT